MSHRAGRCDGERTHPAGRREGAGVPSDYRGFQAQVQAAKQRVTEYAEKKRQAEGEWVAHNYPNATGLVGGVLTVQLAAGHAIPPPRGRCVCATAAGKCAMWATNWDAMGRPW